MNIKKYLRFLSDKKFRFDILASRGLYSGMADKEFLEKKYKLIFGKTIDWDNPRTYNEKLQWLKLYDRNPLYTTLVDKYAVRGYIVEKIGEEYLIPLAGGPWKSFDEINFEVLPESFVLKCTHDSGGLVICRDKKSLDRDAARKKIDECLKRNYYYHGREWPYKDVPPRIIAEKYMSDDSGTGLRDYKFFCFDGNPKFMFIATDRASQTDETKFDFFDMEFKHLPFTNGHPNAAVPPKKPECFEEMKELAEKLTKGIPQVRADFYEIDGKVYFGELTLFHWSGMVPFVPSEWDKTFGDMITLPRSK